MKNKAIHIGTSGWHYDHWVGPFYPNTLPKKRFLSHYMSRLSTVEINNTFYQLPQKNTFTQWREEVPEDFIFAVKASRYITHVKKLKDAAGPVKNFLERVATLKDKLGPVLFQLPPKWKCNLERLNSFLDILPSGHDYAFEFRNPTWLNPQVYEALVEHNTALCIYEFDRRASPKMVTSNLIYIRLHGPDGPYRGKYTTEDLTGWAKLITDWANQGKKVYCYFDNDERGFAVENALELRSIIKKTS